MPIYAYRCESCGATVEALQKLSEPPLVDCESCGQPSLKKQLTAPVFRLKGGGWYETDFKKDGKRNIADDKGGASAAGSGDSSSGSGNSGSSASSAGSSAKNTAGSDSAGKSSDSGKGGAKSTSSSSTP